MHIMKNNICLLLNILYNLFELSRSQYIMMNRTPKKSIQCDPNNNLVEQFFNIIFTEFHHTQPICVCVQMCLEKPTYCYPNGCLRKPERKEDTTTAYPVNRIQYDSNSLSKSVMFLVDNDKDLTDQIFEEPKLNSHTESNGKYHFSDLVGRPNPFKELVFKYRKIPKLEMKYNLREKVRNTQSEKVKRDKLDVVKTRWPLNKHLMHGKQLFNRIRHYKKDNDEQQTFFTSMFPDIESENNVTNNKRLLTKRDNGGINIDNLYVYKSDANFSIENLIDDLIINSLDDNHDAKVKTKVIVPTIGILADNLDRKVVERNDTLINEENVNTTTNIVLMNSSDKSIDTNNYFIETNSTKNNKTYLEEIANMAEKIERNNNASIEFVKSVTGLIYLDFNETTLPNIKNSSVDRGNFDPILNFKQEITNNILNMTTESSKVEHNDIKRYTAPVLRTNIKKKSKQKIIRKLNTKLS